LFFTSKAAKSANGKFFHYIYSPKSHIPHYDELIGHYRGFIALKGLEKQN